MNLKDPNGMSFQYSDGTFPYEVHPVALAIVIHYCILYLASHLAYKLLFLRDLVISRRSCAGDTKLQQDG